MRFKNLASIVGISIFGLFTVGCATSPFDAQNVQRLLTYEEKSILNKAYKKSPCKPEVYSPLLLSIQDRHWRPVKQKDSMCDLVKSIRWVDSNACENNEARTTIEEEFKLFHGVSLQEVCYKASEHGTISEQTTATLSRKSKHDLIDVMDAMVKCDAVRYGINEISGVQELNHRDYQKVSTLIDMCKKIKD